MGGLATHYTNHQQHINTMFTANHSASKYRNQAQKLEEKQPCKVGAHQTDNERVGWDHQIHTSRQPRMIRNHMYTRFYQAPCQLCLTTSLLATDGISHEGPSLESRPSSPPDLRPSGRGPGKTSILFRIVPHYSGEHFPL